MFRKHILYLTYEFISGMITNAEGITRKYIKEMVISMKISTRGRYGLKAMVDIAANCKDGCVSLKTIAERNNLSESYLEQLIAPIKKAGLVKSTRGANGGYILAKSAKDISVGDILRVVEGPLELVECLSENGTCGTGDCGSCITKDVWAKLSDSVTEAADNMSLYSILNGDCSEENK